MFLNIKLRQKITRIPCSNCDNLEDRKLREAIKNTLKKRTLEWDGVQMSLLSVVECDGVDNRLLSRLCDTPNGAS